MCSSPWLEGLIGPICTIKSKEPKHRFGIHFPIPEKKSLFKYGLLLLLIGLLKDEKLV